MSFGRTREFLTTLLRVEETQQWGASVFWVGDKAVGGRMFAVLPLEPGTADVLSFAVPPERFHDVLEIDGVRPAPYLARAHWVAIADWSVFSAEVLHGHLHSAHQRVELRLPQRTQRLLQAGTREYRAAVREARGKAAAAKSAVPKRT